MISRVINSELVESALVVAAEPLLRRLTSTILRQHGFSVSEVSTVKAAESFLTEIGNSTGLLMATFDNRDRDVVLATALRLGKKNPRLKIILASANTPSSVALGQMHDAEIPFLSLPCSFARFSQLISSLHFPDESESDLEKPPEVLRLSGLPHAVTSA